MPVMLLFTSFDPTYEVSIDWLRSIFFIGRAGSLEFDGIHIIFIAKRFGKIGVVVVVLVQNKVELTTALLSPMAGLLLFLRSHGLRIRIL